MAALTQTIPPVEAPLPNHLGPNIFPDFDTFHRLLYFGRVNESKIAFYDVGSGVKATYAKYLSDVLHLRNALLLRLDEPTRKQLIRGQDVCINLLARGSYEFAVGFFAIVALGAVVVPIAASVTAKEALYFREAAEARAIIATTDLANVAADLAATVKATQDPTFFAMPISEGLGKTQIPIGDMYISSDFELPQSGSGLVIFTSGTTGPPKGAVKKRSYLSNNAEAFARWWRLGDGDIVLHVLPVHHSTGISVNFLAPLVAGSCIEFGPPGRFTASAMWERWLQGGLSVFSGVPTMYQRMMRYYEDEIVAKRSQEEAKRYADAAKAFRLLLCGTSALPFSLQTKWLKLLGGQNRILERYGGTEFSGIFSVQPGDMNNPDGSVGKALPGIEIKLSNGDEGEILSRSPYIFTRYLKSPEATAATFTPDGWYKSGDIARREGDYYFILGRASIDIIKSGGYKLSALDIEREIIGLDYVAEAVVVGVEDEEYGQKVAAAIVLRRSMLKNPLPIAQLRNDLRSRLSPYKLPQMLRLVDDFPRTPTGKVVKKRVRDELFPVSGHSEIQHHQKAKL